MAPPLHAWRRGPVNVNYRTSSAATRRVNRGFARPSGVKSRSVFSNVGRRGMVAAGVLPALAGLGGLIGGLLSSKKKKQEGSGRWRLAAHQPFLLDLVSGDGVTWRREIHRGSNEQLRALTDLIRNLYDGVVPLPPQIKLPLKKHIREIRRLSGLKTPLYERRALLLALGARLLPFLRAGLKALEA